MAKKESLITGVDIGSHSVQICQLQKTGKGYKVLADGTASIPAGAVEDGVVIVRQRFGEGGAVDGADDVGIA